MRFGIDAAYAPDDGTLGWAIANGVDWVAGYLGGQAQHVWTVDEWRRINDAGMSLLGIWVAPLVDDAGYRQGTVDGNQALEAMQALGLNTWVALDVESGLRPGRYLRGFGDACHAGSCQVLLYGSQGTLGSIGALADALWLADWVTPGQEPALVAGPKVWQFWTGPKCDYNAAEDGFLFSSLSTP